MRAWLYFLAFGLAVLTVCNVVMTGHLGLPVWAHWLASVPLGGASMHLFLSAGDVE